MATAQRFEDSACWQYARRATSKIYTVTQQGGFARDFGLKDQIRRATVSVMSNIAEGFERDGASEFVHFLSLAKGSAGEVRSQLYVALDQGYIDQTTFDDLFSQMERISRVIQGLMRYLQNTSRTGTKFRKLTQDEA
jgi:four helix bundle protein